MTVICCRCVRRGFFVCVQREQKIKDLSVLFINMHHLINEFRPHQVSHTPPHSTLLHCSLVFRRSISISPGKGIYRKVVLIDNVLVRAGKRNTLCNYGETTQAERGNDRPSATVELHDIV